MKDIKFETIFTEKYSTFDKTICYVKHSGSSNVTTTSNKDTFSGNAVHNIKKFLQEIFLPQGYPASVSSDYTRYQIWDTVQAFCSTITGTLSTHAVMKGVGVGDTEATPLAATITWVLKEGTGNIGRIAFAWWKGTSLDANSKKWRLAADILNDAAICLEVALPYFPGYTTYVLCLSTAMKSIVGVAGGATRAALTQHQAIRGNLADVAAKDGSQETAVNLIASIVAIFVISLVGSHIWPVFFIFTFMHLLSNYKAVSLVCLNTFNSSRYLHCISHYTRTNEVLDPEQINKSESVLFTGQQFDEKYICGFKIKIGSSLKNILHLNCDDLQTAIEISEEKNYFIIINDEDETIYIILDEAASSTDITMAYYHAVLYGTVVSNILKTPLKDVKVKTNSGSRTVKNVCEAIASKHRQEVYKLLASSLRLEKDVDELVEKSWEDFRQKCETIGWRFDKNLLICDEWRGSWKKKHK